MIHNPSLARLSDMSVLVVEDEYYIAIELADEIKRSGGSVIGPYATGEEGTASLAEKLPTCALIDINTGDGPSFDLADALVRKGIPFVFMTGYNKEIIPERLNRIACIQKPSDSQMAMQALADLRRA